MFRDPSWLLWLALALAGLAALAASAAARRKRLDALFGDASILRRLTPPEGQARRRLKLGLQAAAIALGFIALAGPQWGVELVETRADAPEAVIAVDVSLSMTAEDVKPNRLEKAKADLALLLDQLDGAHVGVVAFAGEAAVVCPITADRAAAKQILYSLDTSAIPTPGTAIGKALRVALEALQGTSAGKAVILLTDGEDHKTDPKGAAEQAAAMGVRVFTVGFGSPEGEPLPLKDASGALLGYKKDKKGATVISRLGEQALQEVSSLTRGAYYRSSPGGTELSEIAQQIIGLQKGEGASGVSSRYKNRFQLPLALAFLLLLIEMLIPETARRGEPKVAGGRAPAAGLALLLLPLLSASAGASESQLRKGNKLYHNGEYVPALEAYGKANKSSPKDLRPIFNAGDALYRMEEYEQSAKTFEALGAHKLPAPVRSAVFYNLGNAHMQKGQYKDAVMAYRHAVAAQPSDPDAVHNLAVALRHLKNPPPQKPKQDKKDQPKKDDPQKQDKNDQGGGQDKSEPPPQQPRARPQDQLTREDAERILRASAEKEKAAQKQMQQQPAGTKRPPTEEDW